MLFGVNVEALAMTQVSGMTTERYYLPPSAGIPEAWPPIQEGLKGIVSFRPDLANTVSGVNDLDIVAFLETAPANSWVTIWHEANTPSKNIEPAQFAEACKHIQQLVHQHKIDVHVGQIFNCYPVSHDGQNLGPWIAPDLHFYLLDGYQVVKTDTPDSVFNPSLEYLPSHSYLGIAETNSLIDVNTWAPEAFSYASSNALDAFAFFADPATPPPVFPVLPSEEIMQQIASEARE